VLAYEIEVIILVRTSTDAVRGEADAAIKALGQQWVHLFIE